MKKNIIIIDDEDQLISVETIERLGRIDGIEIECVLFPVGAGGFADVLTEGHIDVEKVISYFRTNYGRRSFDLAAFDWDLNDEEINGPELMRKLAAENILKGTPKLLYSGLLNEKLEEMLQKYKNNNLTKTQTRNRIKGLLQGNILDSVYRLDYPSKVVELLSKSVDNVDLLLQQELLKYPNLKFKDHFPIDGFYEKSFSEISEICKNNFRVRNEFNKEFIQQVMAYLTQMV